MKEKNYRIICPYCNAEQIYHKTELQKQGLLYAETHCKHCEEIIDITYDKEKDKMESTVHVPFWKIYKQPAINNNTTSQEINKETCLEKRISMKEIMFGLGIDVGDIVSVADSLLFCNEKYDLVLPKNKYSNSIPNIILAMVSNKENYIVYKVDRILKYETK